LAAVSSFYEWARATDRFAGPGPIVRVHDRAAARVSERNRPFLDGIASRPPARSPVRLRDMHPVPRPMAGEHLFADRVLCVPERS
jgi:integrase/recombinase XerD